MQRKYCKRSWLFCAKTEEAHRFDRLAAVGPDLQGCQRGANLVAARLVHALRQNSREERWDGDRANVRLLLVLPQRDDPARCQVVSNICWKRSHQERPHDPREKFGESSLAHKLEVICLHAQVVCCGVAGERRHGALDELLVYHLSRPPVQWGWPKVCPRARKFRRVLSLFLGRHEGKFVLGHLEVLVGACCRALRGQGLCGLGEGAASHKRLRTADPVVLVVGVLSSLILVQVRRMECGEVSTTMALHPALHSLAEALREGGPGDRGGPLPIGVLLQFGPACKCGEGKE